MLLIPKFLLKDYNLIAWSSFVLHMHLLDVCGQNVNCPIRSVLHNENRTCCPSGIKKQMYNGEGVSVIPVQFSGGSFLLKICARRQEEKFL